MLLDALQKYRSSDLTALTNGAAPSATKLVERILAPKYETTSEPGVFQAEVIQAELHPTEVNTVVTAEYTMESPTTTLTEPLASAIDAEATNASQNPQRPSRYGDQATAPTATTDAAFVMALIGLALGPYAVVSITLLLLPLLLLLILNRSASFSFLAWARTMPITLIIFVVAFSHQSPLGTNPSPTRLWWLRSNIPD